MAKQKQKNKQAPVAKVNANDNVDAVEQKEPIEKENNDEKETGAPEGEADQQSEGTDVLEGTEELDGEGDMIIDSAKPAESTDVAVEAELPAPEKPAEPTKVAQVVDDITFKTIPANELDAYLKLMDPAAILTKEKSKRGIGLLYSAFINTCSLQGADFVEAMTEITTIIRAGKKGVFAPINIYRGSEHLMKSPELIETMRYFYDVIIKAVSLPPAVKIETMVSRDELARVIKDDDLVNRLMSFYSNK